MPPPEIQPIANPTESEVAELAWTMARKEHPSMPLHYKELFHWPEWATPPQGEIYPYWKWMIKGFYCRTAREKLMHPDRFPEPPKQDKPQPDPEPVATYT